MYIIKNFYRSIKEKTDKLIKFQTRHLNRQSPEWANKHIRKVWNLIRHQGNANKITITLYLHQMAK